LIKELPSLVPAEDGKQGTKMRRRKSDSSDSFDSSKPTIEMEHGDVPEISQTIELEVENTADLRFNHKKEELGRNPGEIAFFKLLHSEFKKACRFFDRAEQEFIIREERVTEGMEIMKRPNSIMVSEKWSMLAKSIYRLYKDLLLLETFAIMTYCSFSKILKKHDKVTGHQTRSAFMANIVGKANFTNYPKVLAMITRCEQAYEDVSNRLLQEGKQGLYEDERLFLNMISRLNNQALDTLDPADRKETRRTTISVATASATTTAEPSRITSHSARIRDSVAVAALRSLVEENDARTRAAIGTAEDDSLSGGDAKKRISDSMDLKEYAALKRHRS
jgi:SPX domain